MTLLLVLFCEYQVGNNLNWRFAFWGESILMLPFAILGFVMKPLELKGTRLLPQYLYLELNMLLNLFFALKCAGFGSCKSPKEKGYGEMTIPVVEGDDTCTDIFLTYVFCR